MGSFTPIAIAALIFASANSQAAEPYQPPENTVYLGAGLGLSQLNPQENGSGWHTTDQSSAGFSIYIGYPFHPHWIAELTYADLGEATVAPRNNSLSRPEEISYQVPSLTAAYSFWYPRPDVQVYVRAGVAGIINKNTGDTDIYEKNTSAQIALGLGVQWHFSEKLFARLDTISYDVDAQMVSLSIGCWIND
jgi:opacity protein-like surface antigen